MRSLFAVSVSVVLAFQAVLLPSQALASDCGMPPSNKPTVPDATTADSASMRTAASAVREYSTAMTAYLDCLEMNSNEMHLNMAKEQQTRWTEDFNAMAEDLTTLETHMNEQIRLYNQRRKRKN